MRANIESLEESRSTYTVTGVKFSWQKTPLIGVGYDGFYLGGGSLLGAPSHLVR